MKKPTYFNISDMLSLAKAYREMDLKETIKQIGAGKMFGCREQGVHRATNLGASKALGFDCPQKPGRKVVITLSGADTYNVALIDQRKPSMVKNGYKPVLVELVEDVYCDVIGDVVCRLACRAER